MFSDVCSSCTTAPSGQAGGPLVSYGFVGYVKIVNKPGTAQVGAISKAQKDSKTKTTFSTTGDNKSSQKTKN